MQASGGLRLRLRGCLQIQVVREALNKSILDFSAPVIGKAWFSDDSQNQWLTAADFGSASLRCGSR
jgi:hypothetical protein